jgi:hypothetical protein
VCDGVAEFEVVVLFEGGHLVVAEAEAVEGFLVVVEFGFEVGQFLGFLFAWREREGVCV